MHCSTRWYDDLSQAAPEGKKLTYTALWWALAEIASKSKSIRACAQDLQCSWAIINRLVMQTCRDFLLRDPQRFDNVSVLGVDEHVWRHTDKGSKYVTVIVDLTPRQSGQPARLLDMVQGRSQHVFSSWLDHQSPRFRSTVRVVAMDAFDGYKKAVRTTLPHAREVVDPFHVVKLAGQKLTDVRCRLQREETGKRGTKNDPLYRARKSLLKTASLRSQTQQDKVDTVLHTYHPLKLIHGVYQKIIACYAHPDKRKGRRKMRDLIDALARMKRIASCPELATLARTLKKRKTDILAYFTFQYSSNGPTEAINGRLEILRGIALGFTSLENYTLRSLLHSGGFQQKIYDHIATSFHTPYTPK